MTSYASLDQKKSRSYIFKKFIFISFLILIIFGPSIFQVFNEYNKYFRSWTMYTGRAVKICRIKTLSDNKVFKRKKSLKNCLELNKYITQSKIVSNSLLTECFNGDQWIRCKF